MTAIYCFKEERMLIFQAGIDAFEDNKYLKVRNNEKH